MRRIESTLAFFPKIAISLVFFVLSSAASALPSELGLSQTVMTVWTDREGLPSDTILDVVQDRDGYIWLASYDGLVRFDGESFSTLTVDEGGFSGRSARVLALGPSGELWVGTNTSGLYVLRNGLFKAFGKAEGLPDLSLRAIAFDREGKAWVGTAAGIAKGEGDSFRTIETSIGIPNFLLALPDGGILAGTNLPGLWLVGEKGATPYLPSAGFEKHSFSSAFLDPRNELWLGTSEGMIFRVARNEIVERYESEALRGASVNEFFADPEGTLWIATDKGIIYRRGERYFSHNEENGLPSNVVSALCRDREGSLWVGTERGGLVKFSPGKFVNISERDGLVSDSVNAVEENFYGSLWVATDEGVSFLPSPIDPYRSEPARKAAIDAFVASLKGVRVRQVRAEADGSLWFATYSDKALLVLEADGGTRTITKKSGLPIDRVRFSYRGRSGDLWIGTTAGPARLGSKGIELFGRDHGLPNLFTLCALEDRSGGLWLGTDGGGAALLEGGRFKVFTTKDGLAGNVIFRIVEDAAGRLWFCTSEGLSLYSGGRFLTAGRDAGLGAESVFQVLEDPQGRLWAILGRRIVIIPSEDLAAALGAPGSRALMPRIYDRLDGLAGQLTANAWASMNRNGVVHLPTLKGLSTYNPQSVPLNSLAPPVLIESVLVDGRPVATTKGVATTSSSGAGTSAASADSRGSTAGKEALIELKPGTRRLTIRYTALSYMIPQRVHFRYLLEGYDRDWIQAGTAREIGYTGLPPGEYRFRVRAENNDGIMNEDGASLAIEQKPYFTQTPSFYILVGIALVGIGFLFAYLRVRRLEARGKELGRLVEERTSELAHQKALSDGLLLNVLPPAIADELKAAGRAQPRVYPDASVLFADIVGFTSKAASMEPQAIIEELNAIFTLFDDTMAEFGCERIKTIGDGYLAAAGLPVPVEDHAKRLVGAAVEALRRLEKRNATAANPWKVRMAVHSGPVVGGVVGVKKYIFDIFGDTVNTAFRLQGFSAPLGLTISEETYRKIGREFSIVRRPLRSAKGKGKIANYYVRHREGTALLSRPPLEIYRSARGRYEEGAWMECAELLAALDLTVCEPELGRAVTALRGNALSKQGEQKEAEVQWALAREFGELG